VSATGPHRVVSSSVSQRRAITACFAALCVVVGSLVGCSAEDRSESSTSTTVTSGDITVSRAFVGGHASTTAAAYLHVVNHGSTDDQLVSVSSPDAGSVAPMGRMAPDGTSADDAIDALPAPIPAGGAITFEPGGAHLMLQAMASAPEPGDSVTLHLVFGTAAPLDVRAAVVDVSDIPDLMEAK